MVSVIMAVYNGEKYIQEAIESVFNQTYKDIELVVVDDGSTDNTRKIVEKYEDVIYRYQENKGQGSARNLGIEVSKGEYLAFLDSDDLYAPDKIEKQLKILLENNNIDVVYNDLKVVDENLKYLNILKSEGIYERREDLLANIIYRQVIQGPICMMLRRKCIEDIKWSEELIYAVDYEYVIKLALKYNFKYLEEPLYIYRRHESNLSNKHNTTLEEEIRIVKKLGIDNIKKIVSKSNFTEDEKKILLSKIYIKIHEYTESEIILQDVVSKNENSIAYFYLGLCFYHLNNIAEAIKNYKKAIEFDNEMAEAYNNLACCIYCDDRKLAQENLEIAIKLRKEYIDAKNNLRLLKNRKNNLKVTERELRKILTLYKLECD
ncbi:glycosyltransferase family 2 protein [Clostridium neonatale]|uniref:glycosyltransferase family 2 protein n=1 Tax=Clostridium neonatale TaxID=137838 RepID=UPI00291BAE1D|nr:glycosyltransferase [Clostridium neonatale]CAI3654987.1 alpha-1,3-rhamnosyltransferase [Clostridium neonatale]